MVVSTILWNIWLFRHMHLSMFSFHTFFIHEGSFLFPTIIELLDFIGPWAKHGTYIFRATIMKVVHFEFVQVWKFAQYL